MTTKEDIVRTTIEILGKTYQINCPMTEVDSLQRAAIYLENKMRSLREEGTVLSIDRIAVITALNIAHQYLALEQQATHQVEQVQQRLQAIHNKVDMSLSAHQEAESIFAE